LNKLALSMPKCAFAGDESVSEHGLERSRSEVLDVVLGICHQHLLYEVMPTRQEHAPRTNAEVRERTILTGSLEQEAEKAGAELADVPTEQRSFWAGRQPGVG
jgi:hypothetical protein